MQSKCIPFYWYLKAPNSKLYLSQEDLSLFYSCFLPIKWHRAHSELKSNLHHFNKAFPTRCTQMTTFYVVAKHILLEIHQYISFLIQSIASPFFLWHDSNIYWMITLIVSFLTRKRKADLEVWRRAWEKWAGSTQPSSRTSLQRHLRARAS